MKHVKENDLVHGEWSKWCESIGMSRSKATRFITVYNEWSLNGLTSNQMSLETLYHIATMPEESREQSHTIPSTGETKAVDEMTVRELREVKAELKQAEQRAEAERKERERLEIENEELADRLADIPENEVPSYMTNTKLQQAELKNGQKAALVIRLYYEEERQKAEGRRASTLKQNTDDPMLEQRSKDGRTHEILANKAGIGKSSMAYLIAVYRSRSDLFELVFDGTYSINRAYTQMKADESKAIF